MNQVEIAVRRSNDLDTVVSVKFTTTNLTATPGTDYLDVSTNLTFHTGETNLTVAVRILNDSAREVREAFQVGLSNPTGGAELGDCSLATVRITDNDPGLQIDGASYQVREHDGSVLVGVLRGNDGDFPVTVEYATADDTAKAGEDYTPVSGQLDFAAGEQVKQIEVPILNDGIKEANETFRLYLTNVTGTVWGTDKSTTITVVDNDIGVHFEPNAYWVSEREGTATLTVVRGNDTELGAFTVDYATRNGVALAGEDYVVTKGTLQFAEGELAKVLRIPIIHDETAERDEQFIVTLSNSVGDAELQPTYSVASVRILESVDPWGVDRRVAQMVAQVQPHDLRTILSQLTGEECVLVGGDAYVLRNRITSSDLRAPIWKATQFVFESLQSLGLDVQYQGWKWSSITNRNVVGTQTGESRTNEYVLITAHLDDYPISQWAPGANDNASGVAAVLTAARIFSQHRFERTVQFVLFTGHEQGGLGSAAYAARAQAEKQNLVAVINLDMPSGQPSFPPWYYLLIRSTTTSHPDFAIAYPFLKVVQTYELHDSLWPSLIANPGGGSDHMNFWSQGFPALWLVGSSDPYYNTVYDTVRHVNLRYLAAIVQATVGAAAHLAQPTGERPLGIVEVATSDWAPGSGIGGALFYAKHETGASENEDDAFDLAWANAPTNANPQCLRISTESYGVPLQSDARPLDSETMFRARLSVVDTLGTGVSCANRLRFNFLTPPDTRRIYLARMHLDGRYVPGGADFDCVTNLQEVIAGGGFIDVPDLNSVPNGAVYGACDLAARFLDTQASNCRLRVSSADDRSIVLMACAQLGTRIIDDLEVSRDLGSSAAWTLLKSYTNYVSPDAAHFETGWTEIEREFDRSLLPESRTHFFRLKRTWISP